MGCRLEVSQIWVVRPVISALVPDWVRLSSRVSKLRENERRTWDRARARARARAWVRARVRVRVGVPGARVRV